MKYLKRFNESIEDMKLECEDILIPLIDDDMKIRIVRNEIMNNIQIIITDLNSKIKTTSNISSLEHLFSYLESNKFRLKSSYSSLSTNEIDGIGDDRCPSCGSYDIGWVDDSDLSMCNDCNFDGYPSEFVNGSLRIEDLNDLISIISTEDIYEDFYITLFFSPIM